MSDMRWKVGLDGNEQDLQDLCESFDEDPKIFEEEGDYYLWTSKFSELKNLER